MPRRSGRASRMSIASFEAGAGGAPAQARQHLLLQVDRDHAPSGLDHPRQVESEEPHPAAGLHDQHSGPHERAEEP